MSHWSLYEGDESAPWNLRRVVHLHRRAGFAATWSEIQRDRDDGPDASINRLLKGESRIEGVPQDFDHIAALLADAAVTSRDSARLKAWWIYRMLFSPDPLGERLTLMWHNHFATSNLKVQDLAAMRRQNEILRDFARAPFAELLLRVVKDPATLVWLDAQANRKEHPNENLAREIMELFTLGVESYRPKKGTGPIDAKHPSGRSGQLDLSPFSETDVKEAARAFTGWAVKNDAFREYDQYHDDGEKTIFGKTGRWRGDDFVRMLLEHQATPKRLAFRICELLMGEGVADANSIDALAEGLREHDLNIGWAVETVLRSEAFFADQNIGNRVLGPVEFVIGSVRALEMFDPPPSTLILSEWTANLGQDLFYPPNVFGWPGGRTWITSRSVIGRTNIASALVNGSLRSPASPVDGFGLARKNSSVRDVGDVIDFFSQLLLGQPATPERTERTLENLRSQPAVDPATIRHVIASVLSSPEAQLG